MAVRPEYSAMSYSACRWLVCLLCICPLAAGGCSLGPYVIRGSRTKYNDAVQTTAREEMLLNVVRARYNDPPEFLAVSGITTQAEVGGLFGFGQNGGIIKDANLGGNFNAANRPTISFIPLQDEQFTRRYLSPVRLDTIYLFARNGRNVNRLLRLIVENVNGLSNSSDDQDPGSTPGAFQWIAQALDELARRQHVEIAYEESIEPVSPLIKTNAVQGADVVAALGKSYQFRPGDKDQVLLTGKRRDVVLRISPQAVGSPEVGEITRLLSLRPGATCYPIKQATEGQLKPMPPLRDELLVSTRSVEEILHFVGRGVEVPLMHLEKGLVSDQDGPCLTSTVDLLRIRSSKGPPCDAYLAVCYRGHWFYIEDADPVSRATFELLLELYYLEIRGGGAVGSPLLTLPVGR